MDLDGGEIGEMSEEGIKIVSETAVIKIRRREAKSFGESSFHG